MPIKYKGVGGTNFTSTYPINVKRKVSSEECAPLKIDYSGKKEAVVEEGTVWEPDYLKFECRGKNAFWMGFLSTNGALAETADPDIEYSFDRLNWSRVPTHLADAVEFGDQATNPQHKEVFLRAMMTPGQSVRTTSPLHNVTDRYRHFCWRDPAWEVPEELVYRSNASVTSRYFTNAGYLLSSCITTSGYSSYFSIYVLSKEYCEEHNITSILIGGTSTNSTSAYKIPVYMVYAAQQASGDYKNIIQNGVGDVNGDVTASMLIDFPEGATHIVISALTGYLKLHSTTEQEETPNGVIVSGSLSSLIDGSGNANWSQSHICPNSAYLFSNLFAPNFSSYNYINPDVSYPAIIDAYNLSLPYDSDPEYTSICTGNKYQFLCSGLFYCNFQLRRAPKEIYLRILSKNCFSSCFRGCGSLVEAPNIYATVALDSNIYRSMFHDCIALQVPLKCKTSALSTTACFYMYYGCLSLESVPQDIFPEFYTSSGAQTFSFMFGKCMSLKSVPMDIFSRDLATAHRNQDYERTFYHCSSLEVAPEFNDLPYGTTKDNFKCCFQSCTSLTDISRVKIHFNDGGSGTFTSMFEGCTSLITLPHVIGSKIIVSATSNQYAYMFRNSGIIEDPGWLIHCNKSTAYRSFFYTFSGCFRLESAASMEIDVVDTAQATYCNMFSNCRSLIEGPHIISLHEGYSYNATSDFGTYHSMFSQCTAMTVCGSDKFEMVLEETPYSSMIFKETFTNCTSLLAGPTKFVYRPTEGCSYYDLFRTFFSCLAMTVCGSDKFEIVLVDKIRRGQYSCISTFHNCQSLLKGPDVLDITAYDGWYLCSQMFMNCYAMTELGTNKFSIICDATGTIAETDNILAQGFNSMFQNCTSLVHGPRTLKLVGNTGGQSQTAQNLGCFSEMFENCTSLVDCGVDEFVVHLTSKEAHYMLMSRMFYGCESLVTCPLDLEWTGAVYAGALQCMFQNCKSLSSIKSMKLHQTDSTVTPTYNRARILQETFSGCEAFNCSDIDIEIQGIAHNCTCQGTFRNCTSLEKIDRFVVSLDQSFSSASEISQFDSTFYNCKALQDITDFKFDIRTNYMYNYFARQMFFQCYNLVLNASDITLDSPNLANSCYQMMFQDAANLNGAPHLPAKKAATSCYEQMFFNAGNPDRGGTRITEAWVGLDASGASASNATRSMFAHYQGSPVQFHVPAGNPYGWIADTTTQSPANKHLHTTFTIVDDL